MRFGENYNPDTGMGYGADGLGSCLIVDWMVRLNLVQIPKVTTRV